MVEMDCDERDGELVGPGQKFRYARLENDNLLTTRLWRPGWLDGKILGLGCAGACFCHKAFPR